MLINHNYSNNLFKKYCHIYYYLNDYYYSHVIPPDFNGMD